MSDFTWYDRSDFACEFTYFSSMGRLQKQICQAIVVTKLNSFAWKKYAEANWSIQYTVTVKTGKDIGGLDSIFSATVGNNVLVKMATTLKLRHSEKDLKRSSSAIFKYSQSADLLAKRVQNTSGGPISKLHMEII